MAAFHLRNIPDELYARLRARAEAEGRSVNSEILTILERHLARPSAEELNQRLEDLRGAIKLARDTPTPEDLIREDRDAG